MYTQNVLLLKLPWRSGRIGAYRACRWGSIHIGGCLRKNPFFGFAPRMLCNSSFCPLYAFHSFNYRICKHCIIVCLLFVTTCIIRNKKLYESKVVKTLSYIARTPHSFTFTTQISEEFFILNSRFHLPEP